MYSSRRNNVSSYDNKNTTIRDYNKYNFAVQYLEPVCETCFKRASRALAVRTVASKGKSGSTFHRAAFKAYIKSIENINDHGEQFNIECKIYNKVGDVVVIDYKSIINEYYNIYATVIGNKAYYLDITSIMQYQTITNGRTISRDLSHITISGTFFKENARYIVDLDDSEIEKINQGKEKYNIE